MSASFEVYRGYGPGCMLTCFCVPCCAAPGESAAVLEVVLEAAPQRRLLLPHLLLRLRLLADASWLHPSSPKPLKKTAAPSAPSAVQSPLANSRSALLHWPCGLPSPTETRRTLRNPIAPLGSAHTRFFGKMRARGGWEGGRGMQVRFRGGGGLTSRSVGMTNSSTARQAFRGSRVHLRRGGSRIGCCTGERCGWPPHGASGRSPHDRPKTGASGRAPQDCSRTADRAPREAVPRRFADCWSNAASIRKQRMPANVRIVSAPRATRFGTPRCSSAGLPILTAAFLRSAAFAAATAPASPLARHGAQYKEGRKGSLRAKGQRRKRQMHSSTRVARHVAAPHAEAQPRAASHAASHTASAAADKTTRI
jgi:hypothetical protein